MANRQLSIASQKFRMGRYLPPADGEALDLAALALSQCYFDQFHFSSEFRKLVGQSSARYREQSREADA